MSPTTLAVIAAAFLLSGCSNVAKPLEPPAFGQSTPKDVLTLQYRVARDAIAPSRFVEVVGNGITSGLTLVWTLPPPKSEEARATQENEKERFHRLLEMLEMRQINGVEFECTGERNGLELHATSVPRLTERGSRDVGGLVY